MNETTKNVSWIRRNRYVAFVIVIGLIDFVVRRVIRGQLNASSLVVVAIAALAASYADKKRREEKGRNLLNALIWAFMVGREGREPPTSSL